MKQMTAGALLQVKLVCGLMAAAAAAVALAASPPEKIFDMTITGGALPAQQRLIRVTKDDSVRLRLTSDAPGDFHLHGYRLAMKLAPGTSAEIAFKAHATGRYPFEWHGAADQGKAARHHGPEFAVLEVYPK